MIFAMLTCSSSFFVNREQDWCGLLFEKWKKSYFWADIEYLCARNGFKILMKLFMYMYKCFYICLLMIYTQLTTSEQKYIHMYVFVLQDNNRMYCEYVSLQCLLMTYTWSKKQKLAFEFKLLNDYLPNFIEHLLSMYTWITLTLTVILYIDK